MNSQWIKLKAEDGHELDAYSVKANAIEWQTSRLYLKLIYKRMLIASSIKIKHSINA